MQPCLKYRKQKFYLVYSTNDYVSARNLGYKIKEKCGGRFQITKNKYEYELWVTRRPDY